MLLSVGVTVTWFCGGKEWRCGLALGFLGGLLRNQDNTLHARGYISQIIIYFFHPC